MKRIYLSLGIIIILGFMALGVHSIEQANARLNTKTMQLQSVSSQLKELEAKYTDINNKLQQSNQDKESLEQQKAQLDKQRQDLENQLQAKKDEQSRLASVSQKVIAAVTNTATVSALEGDKATWFAASGISSSDWAYVDYIISHESGWIPTKWNTAGSGAYGLGQALPASKMATYGDDYMTNPVTQLKWANSYAISRYGSWANAYATWVSQNWW